MENRTSQNNRSNRTRRRFMRIAGASSIGAIGFAGAASAKDAIELPSEDEFHQRLEDQYGHAAANAAVNIIKKHYRKKEKGHISPQTFHNTVTEELLEHPQGRVVAEDVVRTDRELRNPQLAYKHNTPEAGGIEDVDTQIVTSGETSVSSSSEDILLTLWEKDTNTSGGGSANAKVEFYDAGGGLEVCDKQNAEAGAFVYGSSWAYVRFYYTYTPDASGDYKLTIDYYRNGKAVSGGAEMSLYIKDSAGALNSKVVESVTSEVSGNTSRYKVFTLEQGETYDLGFETRCTATTGGGGGFGDFYQNSRHVHPPAITVEQIN